MIGFVRKWRQNSVLHTSCGRSEATTGFFTASIVPACDRMRLPFSSPPLAISAIIPDSQTKRHTHNTNQAVVSQATTMRFPLIRKNRSIFMENLGLFWIIFTG
jgi:hypothetical protein